MNDSNLVPILQCPTCQSNYPLDTPQCWLCTQRNRNNIQARSTLVQTLFCIKCAKALPTEATSCPTCAIASPQPSIGGSGIPPILPTTHSRTTKSQFFVWSACSLLALLIGIGIWAQRSLWIVPYVMLTVPAFSATGVHVWLNARRRKRGQSGDQQSYGVHDSSSKDILITFLTATVASLVILAGIAIAAILAVIAFVILLLQSCNPTGH